MASAIKRTPPAVGIEISHYPMDMAIDVRRESLPEFETRLRTILPPLYQECYEEVKPVSMGSAPLKYDKHGRVAWDEMWDSFCDLAMAGGPPHKGTLLTPATSAEIEAQPDQYRAVVEEICRGIVLVSDLKASLSTYPGWIRVQCDGALTAEWLVRAIVMENISAHWDETAIFLPAGPAYRMEKEIKNVVTVIAKTCHYWVDHVWLSQQREIAKLFAVLTTESPLVQPPFPEGELPGGASHDKALSSIICEQTGLQTRRQKDGWLGLECSSVRAAIWMMRGLVISNVLSRREGTTLFIPTVEQGDSAYEWIVQTLAQIHSLAQEKGIR